MLKRVRDWLGRRTFVRLERTLHNHGGELKSLGYDQWLDGTCWLLVHGGAHIAVIVDRGENSWYVIPNPAQHAVTTAYAACLITMELGDTDFAMLYYWDPDWDKEEGTVLTFPGSETLQ